MALFCSTRILLSLFEKVPPQTILKFEIYGEIMALYISSRIHIGSMYLSLLRIPTPLDILPDM